MRRNTAVDCVRVLAILGVIFAHVVGMGGPVLPSVFMRFTYHLSCFGIVFFFIIAGYYWGKKIRAGNPVGQVYAHYASRILKLFAWFSLFYIFISDRGVSEYTRYGILSPLRICYWNVLNAIKWPGPLWQGVLSLFMTGTKYHLWFLVALAWAVTITAILVKLRRESLLLWVATVLFVFEALCYFLSDTSIGSPLPFNARQGPFFGTFFFVIGYRLSSRQDTFSLKPAVALLSGGFALLLVDMLVVRTHLGFMIVQPFLQVTIGLGAALLALARPSLGADSVLASLGRYVLGVYLAHLVFIDFLKPVAKTLFPSPILDVWLTAMVFLCSVLAAMLIQRTPVIRSLVGTPGVSLRFERDQAMIRQKAS